MEVNPPDPRRNTDARNKPNHRARCAQSRSLRRKEAVQHTVGSPQRFRMAKSRRRSNTHPISVESTHSAAVKNNQRRRRQQCSASLAQNPRFTFHNLPHWTNIRCRNRARKPCRIVAISSGERGASTYSAFLRPAMARPNLTVLTHAPATRIVIENGRATGVEYVHEGKSHVAHAAREIVLSGGAYNSPQLLMLSGIGPADELRKVGIKPIQDLPGVGCNLQDHAEVSVINLATQPVSLAKNLRWDRLALNVLRWSVTHDGPVSRMPVVTNGWYRSRPELERPDIQTLIGANSPLAGPWFPGIKAPAPPMFASRSGLQHPESRGWMNLASADPLAHPRIFFNLFSAPGDLAVLRYAIRKVREIFAASPVRHLMGKEIMPGPDLKTDAELDQFIRNTTTTAYHPVGTCAMGGDENAVVDAKLRVRSVAGLRVADASIMPTVTGGNTNAPCVMIGDKAAAMILGQELPRAELGSARLAAE